MESTKDIEQRNLIEMFSFIRKHDILTYRVFLTYCLDNIDHKSEWFDLATFNPATVQALMAFFGSQARERVVMEELKSIPSCNSVMESRFERSVDSPDVPAPTMVTMLDAPLMSQATPAEETEEDLIRQRARIFMGVQS